MKKAIHERRALDTRGRGKIECVGVRGFDIDIGGIGVARGARTDQGEAAWGGAARIERGSSSGRVRRTVGVDAKMRR